MENKNVTQQRCYKDNIGALNQQMDGLIVLTQFGKSLQKNKN